MSKRRFKDMLKAERDPMTGVFGGSSIGEQGGGQLNTRKLDFLKLNYKQSIDKMTQDLID